MRKFNGFNGGGGGGGGGVNGGGVVRNGGVSSDHNYQHHISIGIRSSASHKQQSRYGHHHHHRRLFRVRKISIIGALIVFLAVAFLSSVFAFIYLSSKDKGIFNLGTISPQFFLCLIFTGFFSHGMWG